MPPVTPCLWFDNVAEAAVEHYLSIFPNSRRLTEAGPPGSPPPMMIQFELDGTAFLALNTSSPMTFSPAVSFVIDCQDQREVDHYWEGLLEGGAPSRCGWLTDRFGVSWQVVPRRLGELMGDPDPARAERVLQAMLQMVKLEVDELEAAAAAS